MALELVKICPRSFLLQVPEAQVSWLFNAWPDIVKYMVQQERQFNGLVYPDLRLQTDKGISANLIEFPLLYALFIKGMIFRGEKPSLIGTPHQLKLACEGFRRGLYGFYDVAEMEGCDLTEKEAAAVMREIEGMAFGGIQPVENTIELVELKPLEEMPGHEVVTEYKGVRIWKEGINVFGVEYGGERIFIDCNLAPGEHYESPLHIDVKNVPYKLFQIIDTGEEDGFSPKSCMHTVIQWRHRALVQDSGVFGLGVPVYLQNKIIQHASEVRLKKGEALPTQDAANNAFFVGEDMRHFFLEVAGEKLDESLMDIPVFGEALMVGRRVEQYRVVARRSTMLLRLEREELAWMEQVPLFKLRLGQLATERAIHVQRAQRRAAQRD